MPLLIQEVLQIQLLLIHLQPRIILPFRRWQKCSKKPSPTQLFLGGFLRSYIQYREQRLLILFYIHVTCHISFWRPTLVARSSRVHRSASKWNFNPRGQEYYLLSIIPEHWERMRLLFPATLLMSSGHLGSICTLM